MKRYIKASFDNEVPGWLIADKEALKALSQEGVDLKKAVFSKEKSPGREADYVIYKLPSNRGGSQPGYKPIIYIPEVYSSVVKYEDDDTGERKRIEYFSKKRLAEMAEDIVYVNKANSGKVYREHYEDPRYENGKYMGQTWGELPNKYSKFGHKYGWSKSGKVGGDYLNKVQHDKSGYAIPNPKDKLARFYGTSAGLDSLARKVEKIYDDLLDLKEDIFSVDFSDFGLDYEGQKDPASCTYGNMLSRFGNAVREYRLLLDKISNLKAGSIVSRYTVSSIMDHIKAIEYSVRDTRRALDTQRD